NEERQGPPVRGNAPGDVDGAPPRHRRQPRPGFNRDPRRGPSGQGPSVSVLDAFFGYVDVAGDAHRGGEHEGPLAAVRLGDGGFDGRTHEQRLVESPDRSYLDPAERGRDLLGQSQSLV